ncbi:arginine--tRNA ligase [Paenibacillus protaetiae]|uniref:Arginine--tRNA ligase n=1 Tax=Paenibacillus protaetiae TaxID=2509456 RepID=A0A4P6EYT8_9BACL|nr:arginine--tRNA ligase [Paenibacillus protaetiae]
MNLKHAAASHLAALLPDPFGDADRLPAMLEYPAERGRGDVAFPCFALAKAMQQSPAVIARQLAEQLNARTAHFTAHADGPYVNFAFDRAYLAPSILQAASAEQFGQSKQREGRRIVIDLSSPNIAKPFGIGHLRSTMIGNAVANLLEQTGAETVRVNHIGDWGTQFGKMIAAYLRWADESRIAELGPIKAYLELYVKFHEEAKAAPALEDEARSWFHKLETGDEQALPLWRKFVDESMQEFNKLYSRLGVRFDHVLGESFYNDKMDDVTRELEAKGLLEESDGALVVRLDEYGLPPCLIVKSDGASIYATRDLATALYRHNAMGGDELLYVVGGEQALHFRQLFLVLAKLGYAWVEQCRHISFGLMKIEGRKMSTRKGKVVFLEEVLDEAVQHALSKIEQKNPDLPDKEQVAEAIGVGAVIFADLKNTRQLEVNFSLEDIVQFDGETGPYLQYTYARTRSLLAKALAGEKAAPAGRSAGGAGTDGESADPGSTAADAAPGYSCLSSDTSWELLTALLRYPEAVSLAADKAEPSVLAKYLLELARLFNRFYTHERVLAEHAPERLAKLRLTEAAGDTIRRGLAILGIETPEQI